MEENPYKSPLAAVQFNGRWPTPFAVAASMGFFLLAVVVGTFAAMTWYNCIQNPAQANGDGIVASQTAWGGIIAVTILVSIGVAILRHGMSAHPSA